MKKTSGGGAFNYGPITIGGSYMSHSQERNVDYSSDSQRIQIKGMQLIGFKCHMLPKSPDSKPDIEEWV